MAKTIETKNMKTTKKVGKNDMLKTLNEGLSKDLKNSDKPKERVIDTYRPTTVHGGTSRQQNRRDRQETRQKLQKGDWG